jgi:hypothetical protein
VAASSHGRVCGHRGRVVKAMPDFVSLESSFCTSSTLSPMKSASRKLSALDLIFSLDHRFLAHKSNYTSSAFLKPHQQHWEDANHSRKLNSNNFDPADKTIWHTPGFSGLDHRYSVQMPQDALIKGYVIFLVHSLLLFFFGLRLDESSGKDSGSEACNISIVSRYNVDILC